MFPADDEILRSEIRLAERQVQEGHYFDHDEIREWVLSWGTDNELPTPRCVCGEAHDA